MIAASPLSGCPLAKPAAQILRWSIEGKGTTIGLAVGVIMIHWGVSSCCTNPPVAKVHRRNDTHTPRSTTEPHPHPQPSPILWGNHCGSDDRDCHTHNLARILVPKTIATPLTPAVHQGPTSRRCGHARHRSTPTPRGYEQTTHTPPKQSRCVPFNDPHVHNAARSNDSR